MLLQLNISDHWLEQMAKREGMSASRILKYAALILSTSEHEDAEMIEAQLLEIEPLVNDLYSQCRAVYLHGSK